MNPNWYSYEDSNPKFRVDALVKIVTVQCPRCSREFRTVPTVLENAGTVYCPQCGARMTVSDPQPVSILSKSSSAAA